MIILAIGYVTKSSDEFSRLWVGYWVASLLALLVLTRFLIAALYKRFS